MSRLDSSLKPKVRHAVGVHPTESLLLRPECSPNRQHATASFVKPNTCVCYSALFSSLDPSPLSQARLRAGVRAARNQHRSMRPNMVEPGERHTFDEFLRFPCAFRLPVRACSFQAHCSSCELSGRALALLSDPPTLRCCRRRSHPIVFTGGSSLDEKNGRPRGPPSRYVEPRGSAIVRSSTSLWRRASAVNVERACTIPRGVTFWGRTRDARVSAERRPPGGAAQLRRGNAAVREKVLTVRDSATLSEQRCTRLEGCARFCDTPFKSMMPRTCQCRLECETSDKIRRAFLATSRT